MDRHKSAVLGGPYRVKQSTIAILIVLTPVLWFLFRPRLAVLRSRFALALRIGLPVYFAILIFQLVQTGFDEDQLTVTVISLLLFAVVWVVAWLITSRMGREGKGGREQ